MKMKTVAAAAALMVAPAVTFAATPTLSEVLAASGITVSGAVDASWDYSDVEFGPTLHAFDNRENSFVFHQLNLSVSKLPSEGFGASVNGIYGEDAQLLNSGLAGVLVPGTAIPSVASNDFALAQAFIQYAGGGVTVQLGRLLTLAGAEVINPAGNVNASRGLLFTLLQPVWHEGVRATVGLGSIGSFTLGINNGTVNNGGAVAFAAGVNPGLTTRSDNNTGKTLEAQLALTPVKAVSTYLTVYSGDEDNYPGGTGTGGKINSTLVDLVTNVNVMDMVSVGLNADYQTIECDIALGNCGAGTGGQIENKGVAVYVGGKAGPVRVNVRSEYVELDPLGSGANWIRGNTLTVGYSPADSIELLVEARNDIRDEALGSFNLRSSDPNAAPTNNDQTTATIKAIYKF